MIDELIPQIPDDVRANEGGPDLTHLANFEVGALAEMPGDGVALPSGGVALGSLEVTSDFAEGKADIARATLTDNFADETCIPTCTQCPNYPQSGEGCDDE